MKPFCYVIDIGTNSARLMLADEERGKIKSEYKLVRTVRTGEGAKNGTITSEAVERVTNALAEFKKIISQEHPELPVRVFATSAVRDASNRDELVHSVLRETGYEIEVISGGEEALLSFTGATGGCGGMIDVGGGSTEIAVGENGMLTFTRSFDTGAVRAKNMFGGEDESKAVILTREYSEKLFSEIPKNVCSRKFYAVGGTATCLASVLLSMDEYDPSRIQGCKVTRKSAEDALNRLLSMNMAERVCVPGLPPSRADIITYGIAVLLSAMDALGLSEYYASDSDNLEGYALLRLL